MVTKTSPLQKMIVGAMPLMPRAVINHAAGIDVAGETLTDGVRVAGRR